MDSKYIFIDNYELYEHVTNTFEKAHIHDCHEIFMLLEGDVEFFAEGTLFPLAPKELVIINSGTPHGKNMLNASSIKCFVIFIAKDFFEKNNCREYEKIFLNQKNTDRKINEDVCKHSGFFGAYLRLKEYTNNFQNITTSVSRAILTEMLHILNSSMNFSTSYISNPQIAGILNYINNNLSSKITLDDIANATYLSKHHICKLFKKYVGYTVVQYINIKRIEKVKELVRQGENITSACLNAGYSDYSTFYKSYSKTTGVSPRASLKKED